MLGNYIVDTRCFRLLEGEYFLLITSEPANQGEDKKHYSLVWYVVYYNDKSPICHTTSGLYPSLDLLTTACQIYISI